MDKHYTPVDLAEMLLSFACDAPKGVVADFTAGEGALLMAARRRWPRRRLLGSDIDPGTVGELRDKVSKLNVACCDLLDEAGRQASGLMRMVGDGVALALLNPPFSCRGSERLAVRYKGAVVKCSRAMAFVLVTAGLLRRDGEVLAILPASCMTSQKDRTAWERLSADFSVETLGNAGPNRFPRCAVTISFVRLRSRVEKLDVIAFDTSRGMQAATILSGVTISRGTRPVHASIATRLDQACGFVHTTELRDGRVIDPWRSSVGRRFDGPAVMIPRIGRASQDKVCFFDGLEEVVLSDCVIALQGTSVAETRTLYALIKANWSVVRRGYVGSCAPYITLERLIASLKEFGVQAAPKRTGIAGLARDNVA